MWANRDQPPTNQQWWPMPYGFQYPNQDASADWATKAALWAKQRMAQEEMAKQHQHYYATLQEQPQPPSQPFGTPPLPSQNVPENNPFPKGSSGPPLPPNEPEKEIINSDHGADNLETVAMDDEPLDGVTPEIGVAAAVTRLDYNHGQPVPLPELGPPPPLPGMQTFDHNHGYTAAAAAQSYGHVPAQRFDYGHQSVEYDHQPTAPGGQWYDYGYHGEYTTDRHPPRNNVEQRNEGSHAAAAHAPQAIDFSSMSEVKKKGLPLWIREGLEKLERQKQKTQGQEQKTKGQDQKPSLGSSTSSLSNIAGYDHGLQHSPVSSPKKSASDDEADNSDEEKDSQPSNSDSGEDEDHQSSRKHSYSHHSLSSSLSPKRGDSSDEEISKSEPDKKEDTLAKVRKMLTEVLLSVTSEEMQGIAREAYNEAVKDVSYQLTNSGGLDVLRGGGDLGVADYGSDSESASESEDEKRTEDQPRHHPVYEEDNNRQQDTPRADKNRRSRSRSHSQRLEPPDEEDEGSSSSSPSPKREHKRTPSPVYYSSEESEQSGSSHSRRRKHRSKRRHRSHSSSPKRRSKHKHRKSKHERCRSRSPSISRSSRKSRKYSRSRSRSPSERKHKRRRSPSPRKKRGRHSNSSSPRRHHREGKKGHKRRSRSSSRSSSPRYKRH